MRPADLEAVPAEIWKKLAATSGPWRTPALASVTPSQTADVRTVVLREVSADERQVVFFTSRRSRKMEQLASHPGVSLLVYDEQADWQVRFYGEAVAVTEDVVLDRWWTLLGETQRAHYQADVMASAMASSPSKAKGRENFAAFTITINRFHSLWLYSDGNEAAEFEWHDDRWVGRPARP